MIVIPEYKPDLLKQLETDFGTSVAQDIWKKITDHQEWLNKNIPVGIILFFYASQQYSALEGGGLIASPNDKWQFCNGGVISNVRSPLLGLNVPDLRGRFLQSSSLIGVTGGYETFSLEHTHTVGGACVEDNSNPRTNDRGSDHTWRICHTHFMDHDLFGPYSKLPPYVELQPYMRIA